VSSIQPLDFRTIEPRQGTAAWENDAPMLDELRMALERIGRWLRRSLPDLSIKPIGLRQPLLTATLCGAAMAAYLLFIDAVAFRSALPASYIAFMTGVDLPTRLLYFAYRSTYEAVVYQLLIGSALVWLLGLAWRKDGAIAPGAYWVGLALGHALNLYLNVHGSPLLYEALRFAAPGVLWIYLYRRHGFATCVLAHVSTHVFLQPMLGVVLR
jgi:hypothetical protein